MKKLRLSTLSVMLFSAGVLNTPEVYATKCEFPLELEGKNTLEQCKKVLIKEPQMGYFLPIDLKNGDLLLKESEITINSSNGNIDNIFSPADGIGRFLKANDSSLSIENSILTQAHTTNNTDFGILTLGNSVATIKNSTLLSNVRSDNGAIITLEPNSTLNLDNVIIKGEKGTAVISYNGKNTVNIDNSRIISRVFLDHDEWASAPSDHIDIKINNSNIISDRLIYIYIDPDVRDKDRIVNVSVENSTLSGSHYYPKVDFNLILNNNSTWELNGVDKRYITNLTLQNSTVDLYHYLASNTLIIKENLLGSGTFILSTNLADEESDKIIVQGKDSGQFWLDIHNSGDEPNAPNGKVTLVETQTGEAQFSLLNREYVDAGAYRYRLNKEGTNWVLSNRAGEKTITTSEVPSEPATLPKDNNTPVQPTTPSENSTSQPPIIPSVIVPPAMNEPANPQRALSEKSNALVSLRQAQLHLVEQGLTDLHHRLGELKRGEQGNVWVKNVNSRSKLTALSASSNSQTSGFEQDIHSLQLGADVVLSNNFRLGGFIGNARSDVDFNNDYGSGKVKGQSFGLYGTYLADNGFYWDNIAKYDRLKAENRETGKRKYHGYTLSTEVGRIHTLGAGWTITPQLQFAWTTLSGQSDEDRLNAYTGRAGVRVAKTIGFNGWNMQPYAEINGVKTKTRHNQVRVNQYAFDVAETGSRFESTLGLNAQFGQHRFGLEGGFTSGKKLDQPYKVQLTYRYSW
ncbi:autotransporter outer membrane beta-barrel domain-containing protein [Rodentibacter haemolyticus]|uniref:Autotransporter outer membrane beta-barrel domain-containing protein n=2 Tax=Rodentibacter haemolyticus TaxID=2778911 RepID=A0ABX6V097_9PAST|nr:autotransporter outer membrane beta-barrel domain-containing protein [Rodentibacter haemolyticus]